MPILAHWEVILSSAYEGGSRVDVSFVEDSVDSDSEELTVRRDNSLVGIQERHTVVVRRHADLRAY